MSLKQAPLYDDLDDLEPDEVPAFELPEDADGQDLEAAWNGRLTRIRLAHPVMRDLQIVGPDDPPYFQTCVDCGKRGHAFHARANLDKKLGRWIGPEAGHIEYLIGLGYVAGTVEAAQRENRQREIDDQRGVGKREKLEDGTLSEPRFLEMRPLTTRRLRRQFPELRGGPAYLKRIEGEQLRDELKGVTKTIVESNRVLTASIVESNRALATTIAEALGAKPARRGRKPQAAVEPEPAESGSEADF
jgi:hypothetical protein